MFALLAIVLVFQTPLETDPAKIVISTGLGLYRSLISPGQGDVCNFSPSCSRYAGEAISKYGPIWGTLMASDRLLRCNPWAYRSYGTHYPEIREMKLHDPVENNYLLDPIEEPGPRQNDLSPSEHTFPPGRP